jgi:hypothetical protein
MSEIKESKSETPSELENRELAEMEAACSSMNISTCQQQKSVFTVASKVRITRIKVESSILILFFLHSVSI